MEAENIPQTLYKHLCFDKDGHGLEVITDATLWFTSAKSFNDPFDVAFSYNYDDPTGELAEKWSHRAVEKYCRQMTPEARELFRKERLPIITSPENLNKEKERVIGRFHSNFGICSLTASHDNLLMWSHYSEKHTGFLHLACLQRASIVFGEI